MGVQLPAIAGQIAGAGMGLVLGSIQDKRQLKQQDKLSQQQLKYQRQLTDYNMSKQLEMWKATSYEAQREQMEKAGLNPALMYGMSGGGGTTTGSAGGNIGGGTAQGASGEGMMGLQLASQMAQIKLMEAQANKTNVEAANIGEGGIDTKLKETNIQSLSQGIKNQQAAEKLMGIDKGLKEIELKISGETVEAQTKRVEWEAYRIRQEIQELALKNEITQDELGTIKETYRANLASIYLRNVLTKAETSLVELQGKSEIERRNLLEQQTKGIINGIMQGWDSLDNQTIHNRVTETVQKLGLNQQETSMVVNALTNIFSTGVFGSKKGTTVNNYNW